MRLTVEKLAQHSICKSVNSPKVRCPVRVSKSPLEREESPENCVDIAVKVKRQPWQDKSGCHNDSENSRSMNCRNDRERLPLADAMPSQEEDEIHRSDTQEEMLHRQEKAEDEGTRVHISLDDICDREKQNS
eukprot:TRINITY_DN59159_c0_g1_i1.p3 TRINITY_DN59159_c0_g1~~TRINITY_DN59159_c0_g1_i1.p3  ORF type:complete len:132 (-),score=14.98 TRINITY_DN59159_c0_g1_i1:725-1120(-)